MERTVLESSFTLRRLASYFGLWTAVGLFFAAQVYADYQYAGLPIVFGQAIYLALVEWYLWALCFPLILWVARRAPLTRARWLRCVAIHLPFTLVLTLVKTGLEQALIQSTVPALARGPTMAKLNAALLTCWLLVVISHALIHQQASRERERERRALKLESELSRAQLGLLRMQLQPHFLFNTLHAISTLMHRDVPAAEEMLAQLSDLLRLTLDQGDRQFVRLKQELEFVRLYLQIQQTRFGDRLRVGVDVDPGLLDVEVPTMILQPLVENAVSHGVAAQAGAGTVTVRARPGGDRMILEVVDDGPGLPDGAAPAEGIGLTNTRARLRHLYGDDHAVQLEAAPGKGCRVELDLPLDRGPES